MKGLFKTKPKTPVELVLYFRQLLLQHHENVSDLAEAKRKEKMLELGKVIHEVRSVLYGNDNSEPNPEACSKLTQEFFREDTFRLLIQCLPKMELGVQQDAIHVIANLHRQRVNSRLVASDYMESNLDLMDILIPGYEDDEISLAYGAISRECIRHQCVTRYVLESELLKKFFGYMQNPCFEIASDATNTFKELLTRHKSTVAEFLSNNFDWFFQEYNSQLLESTCYITRRQGIMMLGEMLLDRSNSAVMVRYVSSLDNMRILMNLLRESKAIKIEAFHVFKLFVANQNKPPEIVSVLFANKSKLLRFFEDFTTEKEDPNFDADKAQVMEEIANLQPRDLPCAEENLEDCEIEC